MTEFHPDFNSTNYYKILGCSSDATDRELRKAYINLARKYHPDKDPSNTEATTNFQKLSAAYEVLSDPIKRAQYDRGEHPSTDSDDSDEARPEGEEEGSREREGHCDEDEEESKPSDGSDHKHERRTPRTPRPPRSASEPSMTPDEAKEFFRKVFGEDYHEFYNSPGTNAQFPYAEDLNDALHSQGIAESLTFTVGAFKVVLLLQWLIKREISTFRATSEIILNWVIIVTFIVAIVNPFKIGPRVVGSIAIFLANINLHFWYGFVLYPSAIQRWSNQESGDLEAISEKFNLMRDICSMCFHADEKQRGQSFQQAITYPITFLNHLAAYITFHFFDKLFRLFNITGRNLEGNQAVSAGLGIVAMTILYPLFFGIPTGAWGPAVATVFYFVNYHLYNSMLFRMSFTEFMIDCITGNLFAVIELTDPTSNTSSAGQEDEEKSQSPPTDEENPRNNDNDASSPGAAGAGSGSSSRQHDTSFDDSNTGTHNTSSSDSN